MEKYVKDGKVAILLSKDGGWSTWDVKSIAFDKRVVEYFLKHKDNKIFMREIEKPNSQTAKEAKKYFEKLGYGDVYFGGFSSLYIKWVPEGTKYYIDEHYGSETLLTEKNIKWATA